MPFKSDAQRKFMHARHPKIAMRWEREHNTPKDLPEKVGKRRRHLSDLAPKGE